MSQEGPWWNNKPQPTPIAPPESEKDRAVRLLAEQLKELPAVRGLSHEHSDFKAWHDTTKSYLQHFLPENSPFKSRFLNLRFHEPPILSSDFPGVRQRVPQHTQYFKEGCETADATLRAAIKHVEELGVKNQEAPAPTKAGGTRGGGITRIGVQQNIYAGGIQNQAIATDNAIQKIGHLGDMGSDFSATLKEIAGLFQQSDELKGKEIKEGLAAIEGLATEAQKNPPQRDWRSMLSNGQAILTTADKATDLAQKLAPYIPTIVAIVGKARQMLGT